jgi:Sugar (pentulose and hexulose) kinases
MEKVIAYDLGTGGIKASLFDVKGKSLAESFIQYDTYYPNDKWHEQKPMDWWDSVCKSTGILLEKSGISKEEITCVALSGHSLVSVPIDKDGNLLMDTVPIWSDTRASDTMEEFFRNIPYKKWYMATGNGDPAECYSVIKLMWLQKHLPEIFGKTYKVLGSKDFVNYMFTGNLCTDPSYASGFGIFNLHEWKYSDELIQISGLPKSIFPEIIPSDGIVGTITAEAARQSGLMEGTLVACGGVDNSCMALGARGIGEGRVYTSLGSSSWIAVTSKNPVIDIENRPFVFAHIEKGYYTSAMSIFSAGSSYRWACEHLCRDLHGSADPYIEMDKLADKIPAGSNGLLFNPSLAGGSPQDKSPNIRGSFMGLALGSTRDEMIRAVMEGIAFSLRISLEGLKKYCTLGDEILFCGGGSKSPLWRQIFADIFNMRIIKTNIDQNAASLGAAAIAMRASGFWKDYHIIDTIHEIKSIEAPLKKNTVIYEPLFKLFNEWSDSLSYFGDKMQHLKVR